MNYLNKIGLLWYIMPNIVTVTFYYSIQTTVAACITKVAALSGLSVVSELWQAVAACVKYCNSSELFSVSEA